MLNSIFTIIGTVIGAGFASGKEIFTFFTVYGFCGFCGLFIANFIIGFIIYKVFCILITYNISSYQDFIYKLIPKSPFLNSVVCNIINIFLLISFVVMVAGFSAYFAQEFNIPYIIGAIIICLLSFFTFLKNVDGIIKVNCIFIPLLIIIILCLGFNNLNCFKCIQFQPINENISWFISSILYSSYNLIIVIPILITLKKYINTPRKAKIVALAVSLFLLIIAIIMFVLLNYYFNNIKNLELPIVFIASFTGNVFRYICGFAILIAIFTTAISSGYGFLNNLNIQNKKLYSFISFLICFIAICLCNIGFGTLLNLLYPILGILGLAQVILIIFL